MNCDAGELCVDRLENAFDVVGDVGLWVPQVEVARPPLEVKQNDRLRLAEASSGSAVFDRSRCLGRLRFQHAGQAQSEQGRAANSQQLATTVTVAGVLAVLSGDNQHDASPRGQKGGGRGGGGNTRRASHRRTTHVGIDQPTHTVPKKRISCQLCDGRTSRLDLFSAWRARLVASP